MKAMTKNKKVSRRNLLKLSAGFIGTSTLAAGLGSKVFFPEPVAAQNNMTPDQAVQALMEGNQRFVTRRRQNVNQDYERLLEVAKGQNPFASILSCADSRVPSEMVFDRGFGDLFVCRVAGNLATTEEIGSLEFGSLVLGAKVIMVMGHERCGAVDAAIKDAEVPGKIGSLIEAIKPAIEQSKGQTGDPLENGIKANVNLQIEILKASPVLAQLIQEGKLKIVGGYYDLDTGVVTMLS